MIILKATSESTESALQERLRRIPASQRAAVTGSFRPIFGRRIYAFDIVPPRAPQLTHRRAAPGADPA